MSKVIRGTRKGLFTFRELEHGDDVLMPFEHWRDFYSWAIKLYTDVLEIHTLLTPPVSDDELTQAEIIAAKALSRYPTDDGFVERRGR